MKKIMFNDRFGLTEAVLDGTKTMTRRAVGNHMTEDDIKAYLKGYKDVAYNLAPYKIGEIVAVAQAYKDIDKNFLQEQCWANEEPLSYRENEAGWNNKMFAAAYYMPHRIEITDIKVERLQDISDEDCIKEGIIKKPYPFVREAGWVYCMPNDSMNNYVYPTQCFADLINEVSGKGTWESNPYVFAYSFKLIK